MAYFPKNVNVTLASFASHGVYREQTENQHFSDTNNNLLMTTKLTRNILLDFVTVHANFSVKDCLW